MLDERAETDESQGQATSNLAWFLTGAFIGAAAWLEAAGDCAGASCEV